ncbi:MAG: hypothetical protein NC218_01100 [Acetobacter sp.]|nr:hypothetical protein [Acetobacter sp.]
MKEYTPLWSGVFEGRFSQFFLPVLLFGGKILPILTLTLSLAIFSFAAILLFKLWEIPQKKYIFILLGLNLITAPYTLSWLYFAFLTLSCLSWTLFIIGGYWLLTYKPTKLSLPITTILFTLSLGGYPPVVNLICILFFTLILNDICFKKLAFKTLIHKYTPHIVAIIFSLILFLFIQSELKKYHLQYDTYNTVSINLNTLIEKINLLPSAIYGQFVITTSFISAFYKYTWLILTITAIFILLFYIPKRLSNLILFFCAISGLILSSLITLFAAQNSVYVLYEPRIDFFGLIYIYIYAASIFLRASTHFIRNIGFISLFSLTFYNIHTIAYASKVWQFGFKAETNLTERILRRIEENSAFSPFKNYTFIQGGTLDFRSRYYLPNTGSKTDSYTLTAPYIPWHLPSKAYKFYYPNDFFAADFDIYWQYIDVNILNLTPELRQYLQNTVYPWPHHNAIYIDNNTIILTLTPEGKWRAQEWLKNNKIIPAINK